MGYFVYVINFIYINFSNVYICNYDNFLLQLLFDTVQDYLKLERIEIAGLKGKSLLIMVETIYEEFLKLYQHFGELPYEVLTPEEEQFSEDLKKFFKEVSYPFLKIE